jgi:hypothetical protein
MPPMNHEFPPRKEATYVSDDINVLALVKGKERYVFLFDDRNRSETLRVMGRYASNAELSFTWYDAAVLSQKVRKTAETAPAELKPRFNLPAPIERRDDDAA